MNRNQNQRKKGRLAERSSYFSIENLFNMAWAQSAPLYPFPTNNIIPCVFRALFLYYFCWNCWFRINMDAMCSAAHSFHRNAFEIRQFYTKSFITNNIQAFHLFTSLEWVFLSLRKSIQFLFFVSFVALLLSFSQRFEFLSCWFVHDNATRILLCARAHAPTQFATACTFS